VVGSTVSAALNTLQNGQDEANQDIEQKVQGLSDDSGFITTLDENNFGIVNNNISILDFTNETLITETNTTGSVVDAINEKQNKTDETLITETNEEGSLVQGIQDNSENIETRLEKIKIGGTGQLQNTEFSHNGANLFLTAGFNEGNENELRKAVLDFSNPYTGILNLKITDADGVETDKGNAVFSTTFMEVMKVIAPDKVEQVKLLLEEEFKE
ncbi:MAG: hypothetical protein ACK5MZ_02260, partial [Aestuariibaculum sp.]